jgi:polysaccharide export outer membrane protein
MARGEEYVVGEGDVLQVTVLGNPDLATTARVTREGQIRLPLIGQVPVAGVALPRIADMVSDRLADGYLVDPQVTVSVQEYRSLKVTIIGMVNRTGVYDFRDRLTLLELLSRAGGLSPDADSSAVVMSRAGGSRTVDLRGLLTLGNISLDVELRDGDSVFVAPAPKFSIAGEVRRPGEYRLEEGMTAIRAVTLAGGYSDRAVIDRLKVIRAENGQERIIEVGADVAFPLRRGDIIVVSTVRVEFCYVTGEVKNAGAFRCDRDTNVLKAVTLAGGFTDAAAKSKIRIVRRIDGQEQVREKVGLEEPVLPDDILVVPKSFF